jgi:hypothetical protein
MGHHTEGLRAARLLSPADYRLWLAELEFDDGGGVEGAGRGSEAFYVFDGELGVDGRVCPVGGAVVIESGVAAQLEARGHVRAAHFGSRRDASGSRSPLGPPAPDGHVVHVLGPGGNWRSGQREGVDAVWFTDSTCPTCRSAFFVVSSSEAHRGPSHSHSQDEIIFLIDGRIRMGAQEYGPGTALCIPGGTRYAFEGLPDGHRFLNFRTDVSYQTNAHGQPLLETAASRDGAYVGDLR